MLLLIVFGGPLGRRDRRQGDTWAARSRGSGASLRWPLAFAAVLALLRLRLLPRAQPDQRRWRWVTPGSVLAAAPLDPLSGLFTLYITFANSYSKTYGTLAGGIVLLLWLNYTAWAILFGAELNSELERI